MTWLDLFNSFSVPLITCILCYNLFFAIWKNKNLLTFKKRKVLSMEDTKYLVKYDECRIFQSLCYCLLWNQCNWQIGMSIIDWRRHQSGVDLWPLQLIDFCGHVTMKIWWRWPHPMFDLSIVLYPLLHVHTQSSSYCHCHGSSVCVCVCVCVCVMC